MCSTWEELLEQDLQREASRDGLAQPIIVNLRDLYTKRSEFYDKDDQGVCKVFYSSCRLTTDSTERLCCEYLYLCRGTMGCVFSLRRSYSV